MHSLRSRASRGFRIDRIIWVVNAAWQRATELRNRMLQELRAMVEGQMMGGVPSAFSTAEAGPAEAGGGQELPAG